MVGLGGRFSNFLRLIYTLSSEYLRSTKTRARLHGQLHDREGLLGSEEVRGREMFVPLTHAAGEAQVDFGEALVLIAGVEQKAHYLAIGA